MAEHKRLERSIVELTVSADIAQKTFAGMRDAIKEIEFRKENLLKEIEESKRILQSIGAAISDTVEHGKTVIKDSHQMILDNVEGLRLISIKVREESDLLKSLKPLQDQIMREISQERNVLDIHRRDLDIYKTRLEKVVKELGLDMKIV
jgi:hypothetical protein